MKKKTLMLFPVLTGVLLLCTACESVETSATPAQRSEEQTETARKNKERKSSWLTENINRKRVSEYDMDSMQNDNFEVFPGRTEHRSEKMQSDDFNIIYW